MGARFAGYSRIDVIAPSSRAWSHQGSSGPSAAGVGRRQPDRVAESIEMHQERGLRQRRVRGRITPSIAAL